MAEPSPPQWVMAPERVVFFSDAVFAIAMTLLALDLRVPDTAGRDLGQALIDIWPKVMSFALSFVVIAQFWRSHLRAFNWIERVDTRLVTLNLILLMVVCFLPFPTAVLGDAGGEGPAVVLYAGSVALASLAQALIWIHAAFGGGLVKSEITRHMRHLIAWRSLVPAVVFSASIVIALLGWPSAAMYSWIAIVPAFWILGAIHGRV